MGVPNIREFNRALLANWAKRYFDSKDSEWKKNISYKYDIDKPNILWSKNGVGSTFWKSATWAFAAAKTFYKWKLGNGENVSFWHDIWVGDYSLKTRFWDLFCICNQSECSVAQVWDGVTLKLTFRRCFGETGLSSWNHLVDLVKTSQLRDEPDSPIWNLESNWVFSIKSFYKQINFG
uniref:Reverse transcriptase zinc-binding domain-containing protein n=1 Tax=Aegilops tauschii subsp. strangulata TaxID=200361 RepID=A0A453GXL2_AEGTS